jgi:hypothetical protein
LVSRGSCSIGAAEHVDRSNAAESKILELYMFTIVLSNDTDQDTKFKGLEVIDNSDTAQQTSRRAPR